MGVLVGLVSQSDLVKHGMVSKKVHRILIADGKRFREGASYAACL